MRKLLLIALLLIPALAFAAYKPVIDDDLDYYESGVTIYPGAGIPLSTGAAWGTSITDNSTNWNTAFGWGNHASAGYLTSVTAHNLISTTHGDTIADNVIRGDIITGQGATPKWTRLAFPASPTGKVLQATATDVAWSTSALGTAAFTASTAYDVAGAAAAVTPTTLGLVIGTNVQAYNSNLTAINQALTSTSSPSFTTVTAALSGNATTVTNGVYTTGAGTVFLAPNGSAAALTSFPTFNQDTTGKSAKTDALNSATTVVNVSSATAPSSGQVLTATGSTAATWQTPTSSGANTALSNLASVAINTSLISDTNNTDDLGSSSKQWANTYTRDLLLNGASVGTSGVGVLAIKLGTIPSSSPADETQLYSEDISQGYGNTGGTITTDGNYKVHTFTSSGTLVVAGSGNVQVLVVAGGAGGGAGAHRRPGKGWWIHPGVSPLPHG